MGLFSRLPASLGTMAAPAFVMAQPESGENQAFVEYQTKPKWKVLLKENYVIQAGVVYEVEDFFTVLDGAGRVCEVWFTMGWHEALSEVKMQLLEDGKRFSLTHPGVYQVTLTSISPEMGFYETQVRLVVNGEVAV